MAASRKNHSRGSNIRSSRPVKMPRTASAALPRLDRNIKNGLVGGGALLASIAAAAGAIAARRRLAALGMNAALEGLAAGRSVEAMGHRLGKSVRKNMKNLDLDRLLAYAGLRRHPSPLRRLLVPVGVLAAIVAATGSALFLLAPKVRAAMAARRDMPEEDRATNSKRDNVGENVQNANGLKTDIGEVSNYATR
jgi:hypothetical protein